MKREFNEDHTPLNEFWLRPLSATLVNGAVGDFIQSTSEPIMFMWSWLQRADPVEY